MEVPVVLARPFTNTFTLILRFPVHTRHRRSCTPCQPLLFWCFMYAVPACIFHCDLLDCPRPSLHSLHLGSSLVCYTPAFIDLMLNAYSCAAMISTYVLSFSPTFRDQPFFLSVCGTCHVEACPSIFLFLIFWLLLLRNSLSRSSVEAIFLML